MIGELQPVLINHCLWNNQRERERERIDDNGAVEEKDAERQIPPIFCHFPRLLSASCFIFLSLCFSSLV